MNEKYQELLNRVSSIEADILNAIEVERLTKLESEVNKPTVPDGIKEGELVKVWQDGWSDGVYDVRKYIKHDSDCDFPYVVEYFQKIVSSNENTMSNYQHIAPLNTPKRGLWARIETEDNTGNYVTISYEKYYDTAWCMPIDVFKKLVPDVTIKPGQCLEF